jgi:hypothetical protein
VLQWTVRDNPDEAHTCMTQCTARYGDCLDSRCCSSILDGCYKRPTLQYAQCRPAIAGCVDDASWLCPGWHLAGIPSPSDSPPGPPSPIPIASPSLLPQAIPQVDWDENPDVPFALPGFNLTTRNGLVWIEMPSLARPLDIKGVSWFGFQSDGCVNQLYRHSAQSYIDFLVTNHFNAVRLPLDVSLVVSNPVATNCGEYSGMRTLDILSDVARRLKRVGIFVMLGIHTLGGDDTNHGMWCGSGRECTSESEQPILSAWRILAQLYCSHPNVIAADLFNEPFRASWGVGNPATDWDLAATRVGNAVLQACPRWLIIVQGVAQNSGQCAQNSGHSCWWGENIQGHLTHPVRLNDPVR